MPKFSRYRSSMSQAYSYRLLDLRHHIEIASGDLGWRKGQMLIWCGFTPRLMPLVIDSAGACHHISLNLGKLDERCPCTLSVRCRLRLRVASYLLQSSTHFDLLPHSQCLWLGADLEFEWRDTDDTWEERYQRSSLDCFSFEWRSKNAVD